MVHRVLYYTELVNVMKLNRGLYLKCELLKEKKEWEAGQSVVNFEGSGIHSVCDEN